MAPIQPITSTNNKPKKYYTPKNTGYLALGTLGIATISAMSKNKTFKKAHKHFAFLSVISSLAHLETLYHHKIKNLFNQKMSEKNS